MRFLVFLTGVSAVLAHPWCQSQQDPFPDPGGFCPSKTGKSCCTAADMAAIQSAYNARVGGASQECKDLHKKVACGKCEEYASHLFGTTGKLLLKGSFCDNYYNACKDALGLAGDYCDQNSRSPDLQYSYPFTPISSNAAKSSTLQNAFPKVSLPSWMIGMYIRPDKDAWWIVTKKGKVIEVDNNSEATGYKTILDITSSVLSAQNEQGLLSLAFAPNFQVTKAFYVYYIGYENGSKGKSNLARFIYSGDSGATKGTKNIIFSFNQPYVNHNGGSLLFKPSDYQSKSGAGPGTRFNLYLSTGDGGDHDDTGNRSGNPDTLFGKILRFSVSESGGYSIPGDNPFASAGGNKGLVYAWGLRNPWRCSFDKSAGDLWCGDVGQERREEITKIGRGMNHGWRYYEGDLCNPAYNKCGKPAGYKAPVADYPHDGGGFHGECVIGGYVYRGNKYPGFKGSYIFADYSNPKIGIIRPGSGSVSTLQGSGVPMITALGEDHSGELYAVAYLSKKIFKIGCGNLCGEARKLDEDGVKEILGASGDDSN